jgi:hypothetical protein
LLLVEGELSAGWPWFLIHVFDIGRDGTTHIWTRGEEPQWALWTPQQPISADLKRAITKWMKNGSEYNWKVLFPPDLHWILQQDIGASVREEGDMGRSGQIGGGGKRGVLV